MLSFLQAALAKILPGRSVISNKDDMPMWLIAGLGNPGSEYQDNRHNVGFMAADAIAREYNFGATKNKFSAHVQDGDIGGEKILLIKPQTFMNLSGKSIAEASKFYKIAPDHIIVMHDELDLEFGRVRVKKGGGAAGHNGIKSTDASLGTPDYWRVRIGIGHPGSPERVHGHVLSDFRREEMPMVDAVTGAIAQYMDLLLKGREADFMSKIALATKEN